MISQGEDHINSSTPLKTQVCIVGSGPAGVTLAWHLVQRGIQVILLEGSRTFGRDPNQQIPQAQTSQYNENDLLYNGESIGLFKTNEPHFLVRPSREYPSTQTRERDRVYGGTSTHWGGQSRPLDPITFEKRPGFPGWPITRETLDPYYAEACKFMGLYGNYYGGPNEDQAGYNFTAKFWADTLGSSYEVADVENFDVDMYQFPLSQYLQFQARTFDDGNTIGESDAHVILNASLLNIDRQGDGVSSLTVGVMTNNTSNDSNQTVPRQAGEFSVEADAYVLACGAVSNARLLLLSGYGDHNKFIGRYLMSQPLAQSGSVVSTSPNWLTPPEQNLINFFHPDSKYKISTLKGVLTPKADTSLKTGVGSCWFGTSGTGDYYHELLPEYTSQVSLSETTDPVFKQRQTKVDWQLNVNEEKNYNTLTQLFSDAVHAKVPDQNVTIGPWANVQNSMVFNGHHLGTTKMSATIEDGVVDANLKLHGVDNLYAAGSSVWASAGISNPTFSIIAFSIRLAEHLEQQLSGS